MAGKRLTFARMFKNACNFLYMPFENQGTPEKAVCVITNSDQRGSIEFWRCGPPPLVSAASTPIAGSNQIPYESLVVSFSIATIQTQLLSPRSCPQLVLSSKLVPSQCADTSVTGKGNFLETMMMLCPARLAGSWRQARGRRLVRIAIQRSGELFLFHRCSPKLKLVAQQEQLIPAAMRVMTFQALSPDDRNMLPQRSRFIMAC
jgi:hypothetical protein